MKKSTKNGSDEITVSVIVLCYNHEKYIRQTLESILMQKTNFRYEVLVGDDASADGTPRILEEYAKTYPDIFKIFLRRKNLGASRNAYETLAHARGGYLANLDGDDFWTDENKLQIQVDFLESHPEFIGCAHRFKIVGEEGRPFQIKGIPWIIKKPICKLSDFHGGILPGHPSTTLKRNIFLKPKYDYSILFKAHRMICDRTSALIYLAQGDFYIMERVMGAYRFRTCVGGDNLTSKLYLNNDDSLYNDYIFTGKLEKYAKNVLHRDAGFEDKKKELFATALCRFILGKGKNNLSTAKQILKDADRPAAYFLPLPIIMLKKVWTKIRYKISV